MLPPSARGSSQGLVWQSRPPRTRNKPGLTGIRAVHSPSLIPQKRCATRKVTTAIPPIWRPHHTLDFNRLKLAAWAQPASTLQQASDPLMRWAPRIEGRAALHTMHRFLVRSTSTNCHPMMSISRIAPSPSALLVNSTPHSAITGKTGQSA
jgi:hypothetical protein